MKGMHRGNPAQRQGPTELPRYLRTTEVADILQVSPKTVSRWAKEGKLPFLKTLGGHRRYPTAEIRQLADELRVQPTA
jgi:excisionase family DNA binding protein